MRASPCATVRAASAGRVAIAAMAAALAGCPAPDVPEPGWEALEPGLDIGRFHLCDEDPAGPPSLVVVRADPETFELRLLAASASPDRLSRPAREWARDHDLAVATNAGMYREDYVRHVGLMIDGDHVNNPVDVPDFRSVLAFGPRTEGEPPFVLADLDRTSIEALRERYRTVIQNLRMVDAERENVWQPSDRRSAAAALGVDGRGRLLFLFNRSPRSIHDLTACLLELPIDVRRAQYLEGGPEAVLFVDAGGRTLEFSGSWSPAAGQPVEDAIAWPIPNVIGIARRGSHRPPA